MHESRPRRRRPAARVMALAITLAAISLPFATTPVSAAPTPLGVNLVRNPGAEEGRGTDGYVKVSIPGWKTSANFTVVRYGAPEFPTKAESNRIDGGKKFFSCGPNADFVTAWQFLALKGRGGAIDAGSIRVRLKARQAGYLNGQDEAQVVLTFLDAQGSGLDHVATVPSIGTNGLFQLKQASRVVPAGTRRMHLSLQGNRADDGGSYCDAYFDNISVKLQLVN